MVVLPPLEVARLPSGTVLPRETLPPPPIVAGDEAAAAGCD
jgi:hypothetical protein